MAQRLTQLPNVRLHDFRAIKAVTHDLGNYGDVIHHSPVVDAMVLQMAGEWGVPGRSERRRWRRWTS